MHVPSTAFWAKLIYFCAFLLLPLVGWAQGTEICNNGRDDDGDNLVDCQDPDCPECERFINCVEPNTCYMPPVYGNPTSGNFSIFGTQDLVLSTNADFTTVTIKTVDGSYNKTVVVTSTGSTIVSIPTSAVMSNSPNTVQRSKGLIITSSEPVQATYRLTASLNQDIVPLKCRAALGYSFYTGSQTRLKGDNGIDERHFVGVMATQPKTVVTFRSPVALEGVTAALGSPFSVTLNAGETYLLTTKVINNGANTENKSISGILVTSDQPIVVNSGSQHNYQPYSGNRDAGIDQLVPVRATGQYYVAVHGENKTANADYIIVVGTEANTSVSISGPATAGATTTSVLSTTNIGPGGVFTYNLPDIQNRAFAITTGKRAYVYHISSYAANEFGMGILPSINPCNGGKRTDFYRTSGSSNDQAVVLIPTVGLSSLTFRGSPYATYGTVTDRIMVNGVEQSVVSFPNNSIATADNVNTITSAERFHVGVVSNTGGASTGNYGFYSNYEAKVDVLNPETNQPDDFYTVAKVDAGVVNQHCLKMNSCGTTNTITAIVSGSLTQSATFDPTTNCIRYTMKPSAPICGRDTIRVAVVNNLGKEGIICLEYINKRTDLIIGIVQSTSFVCQPTGTPVSLTALAESAGGKYAFQWITPDKQILSTSVITGALPGRYILTVGDGNTCSDTRSLTIAADTPQAVFVGTGGTSASACSGTTATYSVSSTPGTLAWTVTNGILVGPTSGTSVTVRWNTVSSNTTGSLRVNVTSPNGCQTTPTQNVTIFPTPTLSATGQNPGCSGATNGRVDLTVSGGTAPYTYQWSNGTTAQDPSGLTAGVYSVTVTDKNGCLAVPLSVTLTNPTTFTVQTAQTNPRCFGAATGTASVSVSGGTPGYGYTWSNGGTTASITGLAAGSYTVTISDVNNCTVTRVFSVTQPPALVLQPTTQNPACNGAATGTVSVSVSGGTGSYGYRWTTPSGDPGAVSTSITGLTAGTYSVTVTDANSCTGTATATLTQPTTLSLTASPTNLTCFGQPAGRVDLTVSGGTIGMPNQPYRYGWTTGATTEDIAGLSAGTYSVTVTDGGNCVGIVAATITQPNPLTANAVAGTVSCANGTDGTISLTVGGGTGTYRFQWSDTQPGNTNQNRTGLTAGTYSVTITDANNCQTTATTTLTNPAALTALATVTNAGCSGAATGAISLTASGGTVGVPNQPYSYSWSTGAASRNIANLVSGEYAVTITDARGCTFDLGAAVLQPRPLSTTVLSTSSNCPGGTGMITVEVRGGTEAYRYNWNNSATSATIYQIPTGTYSLTVTDANNCTATTQATIDEPPTFALNAVVKPVACNGAANAEINLTVEGGTAPYQYRWSNGAVTEDVTGLVAGIYSVTVTDANNCREIVEANVQEPALTTLSETHTNVACFDGRTGAITLTVSGGTVPFAFDWKNSANQSVGSTKDLDGLSAETYRVVVTDKNGCITPLSVTISQPAAISLTLSAAPVTCNGNATGAISTSAAGGTGAFDFRWSNGATIKDLANLSAGVYSVSVTDANNCTNQARTTIIEPTALTVSVTKENIICKTGATGRITLTASGGTPGYAYRWQDPDGSQRTAPAERTGLVAGAYSVTVTDAYGCREILAVALTEPNGLTIATTLRNVGCFAGTDGRIDIAVTGGTPGAGYGFRWADNVSTQNRPNLPAGTYSLTVTDANRCVAQTSVSLTQPLALSVLNVATDVRCHGGADGAIALTVLGGTGNYTFAWHDSETPSPVTTQNRTSLEAGSYAVIVTDQNQCSRGVSLSVGQPEALQASLLPLPVSCFGGADGAIRAEVSGGKAGVPGQPYQYLWSDGSTQPNRTGLAAGIYSLTVTDANACQRVVSTTITQPTALSLSALARPVTCNRGSTGAIDLTVSGGLLPYQYVWSTQSGSLTATTEDLDGLTAGTYNVTVTDYNGCVSSLSVTIGQPTDLSVNTILSNNRCFGDRSGAVRLQIAGGSGTREQFRFTWLDQYGPRLETTSDLQGLAAQSYTVIVTDANGCTATQTAVLSEPPIIDISAVTTDVSCFGGSDGAVDVTVSGGVPATSGSPYNYTWDRGFMNFQSNDEDISGKPADVYSFVATDANNCRMAAVVTISQPNALTLVLSGANPGCNDGSTGAVNLTVLGGTEPYSYSWNTGSATQSLSALVTGTYAVTVTDANQCSLTEAVSLTQPAGLLLTISTTPALCFGSNTGTASVTVSGGTPGEIDKPYSYAWVTQSGNLIATTSSVTGLVAGSYSVVVTDGNSCSAIQSLPVTQPQQLTATAQQTDLVCFGVSTGAIRLAVTGGTAPYSFSWTNSTGQLTGVTSDLAGLSADTYRVLVTDTNGCTAIASAVVTQPTTLTVSALPTDAPCFGATGQATVEVRGGTPDYSYRWSNGATSSTTFGLPASTNPYALTVTDASGCTATTQTTINQPPAFALNGEVVPVACNGGSTGSVDLTVEGGTPGYRYLWSTGATTQDVAGLTSGSYSVTVTDANNCRETVTFNLSQPGSLAVALSSTSVLCFGGSTGTASISASSGTAPYQYLWSTGATTASVTSLSAGSYSVVVTDNNGCTISNNLTISQPTALSVALAGTNPGCFGGTDGTLSLTVAGGISAYKYNWNTGSATQNLTGLTAGTYSVTVADANNCQISTSTTLTQPTAISIDVATNPIACFGASTGTASMTASGGTAPYQYRWSTGATTAGISSLSAGNYTVTITDANGCTVTTSAAITQPTALTVSTLPTDAPCFGATGQATVEVRGGTPDYGYRWSNGATSSTTFGLPASTNPYALTVTDASGCTATTQTTINQPPDFALNGEVVPVACNGGSTGSVDLTVEGGTPGYRYLWSTGATTQDVAGLASGSYSVTVTDANNCRETVTFNLNQPGSLAVALSSTPVLCFGASTGTASISASSGTAPYQYRWSTGATTASVTSLSAGSYSIVVTDNNGCTISNNLTISQPTALSVALAGANPGCFGGTDGTLSLTVAGGIFAYTYNWTNSATTQSLTGLTAGTYSVTVTDANNCQISTSTTLTQPTAISIDVATNPIACFGASTGTASLTASGGTAPYQYRWATEAITASISSLSAGNYTVTITDANGCTVATSAAVTQPTALTVSVLPTDSPCFGATGQATVEVRGGTPDYGYRWSNGATSSTTFGLPASTNPYALTVTDASGCTAITQTTINQPPAFALNGEVVPVACNGGSTGSVDLTVEGGTPGYRYLWSTGATTQDVAGLTSGSYSVTVTDANDCRETVTFNLSQPGSLAVALSSTPVLCFGASTGTASITVTGGTAPYQYRWSTGATTASVTSLSVGSYSVVVTDNNGCTISNNLTISQPTNLSLVSQTTPVLCFNGLTGTASITVTGGTTPYQYRWSTGATTASIGSLSAGSYSVVVTDNNGCTTTGYVSVNEPPALTFALDQVDASCNGGATGSLSITALGGVGPYSYSWNTGAASQAIGNLRADEYTVTITDANGCLLNVGATIGQPRPLSTTVLSTSANCPGGTGFITVEVTGGTPDYAYRWSNGSTGATVSQLPIGSYALVVTDAKGCTATTQTAIDQPPGFALNAVTKPVLCKGAATGEIDLTVEGATPPYGYVWSNGATSQDVTGLLAGIYSVTVTDTNGCKETTAINLGEPTALTAIESHKNLVCSGEPTGMISVTVSGGTAPYSYSWTDDSGQSAGTTAAVNGLQPRAYQVLVTDDTGCTAFLSVTISQPPALSLSVDLTPTACINGATGSASVTVAGGTAPYRYRWSTGATTASIGSLSAGSYSVVITDANGCLFTQDLTVTVSKVNPLSITATANSTLCTGATLSFSASGGTVYRWTGPGNFTANSADPIIERVTAQQAGEYSLTVINADGCSQTATVAVTVNPSPVIALVAVPVSCSGNTANADGKLILQRFEPGDRYDLVIGATYDGQATALDNLPLVPANGVLRNKLANPTLEQPYSVRVFNVTGCSADASATLYVEKCECPAPTYIPIGISRIR